MQRRSACYIGLPSSHRQPLAGGVLEHFQDYSELLSRWCRPFMSSDRFHAARSKHSSLELTRHSDSLLACLRSVHRQRSTDTREAHLTSWPLLARTVIYRPMKAPRPRQEALFHTSSGPTVRYRQHFVQKIARERASVTTTAED